MTEVSVVICTYRRPDVLRAALRSVTRQTLEPERYEILIVDNASDKETESIVREYASATNAVVHYHQEPKLGLCYARNTGVRRANAPIIAFLDDDAKAEAEWLEALLAVFRRYPAAWGVGGKIVPLWKKRPPSWFDDSMTRSLSIVDLGPVDRPLEWPERVIGANMAFRQEAFEQVGLFDPSLDRRGNLLLGHGDTEIQERMHQLGAPIYYTPSAVVHHRVPAERLTKHYFYRRFYGAGRSKAMLASRKGGRRLWRDMRRHVQSIGKHGVALIAHASTEKERFLAARQVAHCWGFVHQTILLLPGLLLERTRRG